MIIIILEVINRDLEKINDLPKVKQPAISKRTETNLSFSTQTLCAFTRTPIPSQRGITGSLGP